MNNRILILNGFDRSGSSFIAGLLAEHQQISYLCQPFSGGELHHSQYQPWRIDHDAPRLIEFFDCLENGAIKQDYIHSEWYRLHSTIRPASDTRVYLIKETKLHLKLRWFQARLPDVDLLGVWRDPRGVLCSLVRNGFHRRWYGDKAFQSVRRLVLANGMFANFRSLVDEDLDEIERMAAVIAVRTHAMAATLNPKSWIDYERVVERPNEVLQPVLERHGLKPIDFNGLVEHDYNIVGKPYAGPDTWRELFQGDRLRRLDRIFDRIAYVSDAA